MSETRDVVEHHVDAFAAQDIEAVMEDYSDDSVLVSNTGIHRGIEEIEENFEAAFAQFSRPESTFEVDQLTIEGDVGYLVWHGETPAATFEFGTDTFVVRDGVIETQTVGTVVDPTGEE